MSRYIDADAFYKDVCDSIDQMTSAGISVDGAYLWAKMQNALENAPSIDIVRCGECKWNSGKKHGEYAYCNWHGFPWSVNGFCSYGKREGE